MDIRCAKCGEPIDIDEFHDIAAEQGTTFDKVRESFYSKGCEGIGYRHGDNVANPAYAILQELAGDDIDGLAADLEDFEYMGMI